MEVKNVNDLLFNTKQQQKHTKTHIIKKRVNKKIFDLQTNTLNLVHNVVS